MSKSYKDAMDKIVLSDDIKNKIINNPQIISAKRKSRTFMLGKMAGIAACFAICVISFYAARTTNKPVSEYKEKNTDIVMQNDADTNVQKNDDNTAIQDDTNKIGQNNQKIQNNQSIQNNVPPALESEQTLDIEKKSVENSVPENSTDSKALVTEENSENQVSEREDIKQDMTTKEKSAVQGTKQEEPTTGTTTDNFETRVSPFALLPEAPPADTTLGFEVKSPSYIPDGYTKEDTYVLGGRLAEITYVNEDEKMTYRMAKGRDDISGDFNEYEKTDVQSTEYGEIELKGNGDSYYTAQWSDKDYSYSLNFSSGTDKNTMLSVAESVE